MLQDTFKKFGYPNTLVKEYDSWLLLCHYKSITLGSFILICKNETAAFSKMPAESFAELSKIIKEVEGKLSALFQYEKINYLMFMLHDPEVHFHIIPRYSQDKEFEGFVFKDTRWPKSPDLNISNEVGEETLNKLIQKLRSSFAD